MMKKFFLLPVLFSMYGVLQASAAAQAITPDRVADLPEEALTAFLKNRAAYFGLNSDTLRTQAEIDRAIELIHSALSMTYAKDVEQQVEELFEVEASDNALIEAAQNEEARKTMRRQLQRQYFAREERQERAAQLKNKELEDIAIRFVKQDLLQPTQAE